MQPPTLQSASNDPVLREMVEEDLDTFFDQQLNPEANRMAAFTAKDPSDREVFAARWDRIRRDPTVITRTVVVGGDVAGFISSYERDGEPEVTYWLGTPFWGQGIATRALAMFLAMASTRRPMHARVAQDNHGSLRVLQKCGFRIVGEDAGFANARGHEVSGYHLTLPPPR